MMQSALIFNIQQFSVNDGPGIRTTVFFTGCPLRCRWCANPESQLRLPQVLWDREKCCHCERCVRACPQAVTHENGLIHVNSAACEDLEALAALCPMGALSVQGKWMSTEEVYDQCRKDLPFYEESGGGVTLSGGEVLLWPEFAVELLERLHAAGIHTAVETTGFASPEAFRRVAEQIDYFLFDVKHWNEEFHRAGTGVSNRQILENLKWVIAQGKEVLPRIPVIPGFNDSLEDADGLCRRLKDVGAGRCQLLPFHQLGEKKYQLLARDYVYEGQKGYTAEDLADYQKRFTENGIKAFF